jgi:hypothetical protein
MKTLSRIGLLAAGLFAFVWFYGFNRYQIFFYQEQAQLFRFDWLYFRAYLTRAGGLAEYAGAFLTQFFYYPLLGALIYTGVMAALVAAGYRTLGRYGRIEPFFCLPLAAALLLLIPVANIHFHLSYALGLLCACAVFYVYAGLKYPWRYLAGLPSIVLVYALTGGIHALVLAALLLLHEWFEKGKLSFRLFHTAALVALAGWMLRTTGAPEAFSPLGATGMRLAWYAVPVVYAFWRLTSGRWAGFADRHPQTLFVLSAGCTLGMMAYVYTTHDATTETINRLNYETQRERWENVLDLKAHTPTDSRHVLYFANIALCQSGRMPGELFRYRQFGTAGLFLDRNISYFSYMFLGEQYYRLGMMSVAEHCTYESMVTWSQKPTAQTLARLVRTTMMRGDFAACEKYIRPFEHTLFYRRWAKEQRALLRACRDDSLFVPPGTPRPAVYPGNFFINYDLPDGMLLKVLEGNPFHQRAFEYLMAWYMLGKDVESAKALLDRYYANFDYPALPLSYEEALLVYENAIGKPFDYPISPATRERFNQYMRNVQSGVSRQWLEKAYGDTYWFYLHFVQPVPLQTSTDPNRY